MKKLLLCFAIILGSFVVKGQDTTSVDAKSFAYKVLSITHCLIRNGEVTEGETIV